METRGCAHRVECSRTGSRRRFRSRCRRAWWPSARREDVRRPCRVRSRPCTTCHTRAPHRDPALDSPEASRSGAEHVQPTRLEAAGTPQARPGAVARVRDLFGMMSDGFLLRRGGGVSAGESRWSEKCTRREAAEWHRAVKKSVREAWEAAGECGARSKVVERAHIDLGLQAPELRVEIHLLASPP